VGQAAATALALGWRVLSVAHPHPLQALQEARRVLEQLPGLQAAALVLMGQFPPPELRR
jgi:hypothetical protein